MSKKLKGQKVAFIGSGMMGGAILHALLANDELSPQQIIASEPMDKRREEIATKYGVQMTVDNVAAAREADVVVTGKRVAQLLERLIEARRPRPPAVGDAVAREDVEDRFDARPVGARCVDVALLADVEEAEERERYSIEVVVAGEARLPSMEREDPAPDAAVPGDGRR